MQIIENWSEIHGIVRTLQPTPTIPGFIEVELQVEKVNPVEGFANLLGNSEGHSLVVLIPEELVKSLDIKRGGMLDCRVRKANLEHSFVHRNHISVQNAK